VSIVAGHVTVRMADFFRRPLRLSLREALTLLLAGRAFERVGDSGELRSALDKLGRVLGGADAPGLALEFASPGDEHLPLLREAVAGRAVIHLTYRSASKAETTERDVEPWALTGWRGAWYLQGWCRLAQAPRDFRLDRIREARRTGEVVAAGPTRRPRSPVYEPAPGDRTVVLDLRPPAWWVGEWIVADAATDPAGDTGDQGGVRRLMLRTGQLEWVARLVLRLGADAVVVSPPELAERVTDLATQTLQRYQTS
jgi:predicted DNA-binding transcriptional regulator YafY